MTVLDAIWMTYEQYGAKQIIFRHTYTPSRLKDGVLEDIFDRLNRLHYSRIGYNFVVGVNPYTGKYSVTINIPNSKERLGLSLSVLSQQIATAGAVYQLSALNIKQELTNSSDIEFTYDRSANAVCIFEQEVGYPK